MTCFWCALATKSPSDGVHGWEKKVRTQGGPFVSAYDYLDPCVTPFKHNVEICVCVVSLRKFFFCGFPLPLHPHRHNVEVNDV